MPINIKSSGIYKITTLHNKKFYIGSSISLYNRKCDHLWALRVNRHANLYLQRVYNKYGEENIKFEVLINSPKEYLIKLEQWFIDNMKPEYNMQRIAGGSALGLKRPKSTCIKISEALKGKKLTEEHKYNCTKARKNYKGKVYQYNCNNNLLKVWDCTITNMAKELNLKRNSVMDVLMRKRNSKTIRHYLPPFHT